jgi:hypothetical protein
MKCYMGGSRDPFEFDFVAVCFANNSKEAKRLMWNKSEMLGDECDGEWIDARVIRKSEYDDLLNTENQEPYIVRDEDTLRKMGWGIEGDRRCDTCGFAEFEGKWPICEECGQCSECGHLDCEDV